MSTNATSSAWAFYEVSLMEETVRVVEDTLRELGVDEEELTPKARALADQLHSTFMRAGQQLVTGLLSDEAIAEAGRIPAESGRSDRAAGLTAAGIVHACEAMLDEIVNLEGAEANPLVEKPMRRLIVAAYETGQELRLSDSLLDLKRHLATA